MERKLDFSTTGAAISKFTTKSKSSVFRFDEFNSLWQLAKDGLPGIQEDNTDGKRDLDEILKKACGDLKECTTRHLLSKLDNWLAMVSAYAGDIPIAHDNTNSQSQLLSLSQASPSQPQLPTEVVSTLKAQQFMKSSRILSVLQDTQDAAMKNVPELRANMKLYITSSVARAILLKPVQHEIELMKRKSETVVASCVEPGQERRDIEHMVTSICAQVSNELVMQLE